MNVVILGVSSGHVIVGAVVTALLALLGAVMLMLLAWAAGQRVLGPRMRLMPVTLPHARRQFRAGRPAPAEGFFSSRSPPGPFARRLPAGAGAAARL